MSERNCRWFLLFQYSWVWKLQPWKRQYPLQINGWKMDCPFEMVPCLGDMLILEGFRLSFAFRKPMVSNGAAIRGSWAWKEHLTSWVKVTGYFMKHITYSWLLGNLLCFFHFFTPWIAMNQSESLNLLRVLRCILWIIIIHWCTLLNIQNRWLKKYLPFRDIKSSVSQTVGSYNSDIVKVMIPSGQSLRVRLLAQN